MSRYSDRRYERDKLKALLQLNKTEIEVLSRNFHHLPDGNEFKDPNHHFSQDVDLFGRGSFYQYLNRTVLQQGSEFLAGILMANKPDEIIEKQQAIKEIGRRS